MIADENLSENSNPQISISNTKVISLIKKLMVEVIPNFKSYLTSDSIKKEKLNENELSQIYTKQAQILIRSKDYPFNIGEEYRDVYNLSRGISDFFFYPNEENTRTASIFSVESKILPTPAPKKREKEYVLGDKNNGGIERYKTEMHGKGLKTSGVLGFIKQENSKYWLKKVNDWIVDLSDLTATIWKKNEVLHCINDKIDYCELQSKAYRKEDSTIDLFHLWIILS